MENEFIKKIDTIIDMLEDDDYKSYIYTDNKFQIIDDYKNINLKIKLGNNNFYYKDNITGLSYIYAKKYIDEDTTICQIFIEEDNEKCYYSFLERNGSIEHVRITRTDGKGSFICDNGLVINKTWEEILEYCDEIFENNEQETEEDKYDEDEYDEDEYDEDEYNNEEYNNEYYKYEFDQIKMNIESNLSDQFTENKISEYATYIIKEEKKDEEDSELAEYEETLLEGCDNYNVKINGKKVDGRAKIRLISDCAVVIEQKYLESVLINEGIQNLKMVLEAKHKEGPDR